MAAADRAAILLAAARRRHDDTRRRAADALRRLDAAGEPVSFASVARAAGVSRAWLYRDDDARGEIERLRRPRAGGANLRPAAERASAESTRSQLEALRAQLVEERAINVQLRAEVDRLRGALARRLGESRAGAAPPE